MKQTFEAEADKFVAGRLSQYSNEWKKITSDSEILQMVKGAKIDFMQTEEQEFSNLSCTRLSDFSPQECEIIDSEVQKLISKQVISLCKHADGEVISPIFTRQKKDGTHRMILNLSRLNSTVSYYHFKMETLMTALTLITKDCFMASIDLKDAYYSVPIFSEHKKFLRFFWRGNLFEFNVLPNGLSPGPRWFTKLMKPVFALLRKDGHTSTSFLDDSLLVADTKDNCMKNVEDTAGLLTKLGFIIHPTKSIFEPTTQIQYLGVVIDSVTMKVTLTPERKLHLKSGCLKLITIRQCTIRELAKVIGMIVASFPAVKYGPLHYRQLEKEKIAALKSKKGDFDQTMQLSSTGCDELQWWCDNVDEACNDILQGEPDLVISTDASLTGWGCHCDGVLSGGHWSASEKEFHINYLELKAVLLALKSFRSRVLKQHVRLMIDNTTAVSCINKMGTSHSDACNDITHAIWSWCVHNSVWISAAHIPGSLNTEADQESRRINTDAEWKLDETSLHDACRQLRFLPDIDLFASRLNNQMNKYVSYRPDPGAVAIDAFSLSWKNLTFYAFPPFSVVGRVVQKIRQERATGILVVPDWPTQPWYPAVKSLLCCPPVELRCRRRLLHLPSQPHAVHPLIARKHLNLMVCKVSGHL